MITKEFLPDYGINIYQPEFGYRYNEDSFFLIEFIRKIRRTAKIADLGAGCGILSLILAKIFPEVKITAVEIEELPYQLLVKNIRENQLDTQIKPLWGDWNELKDEHCQFDVVVSNPPFREVHRGKISCHKHKATARHELTGGLEGLLETTRIILKEKGIFYAVFLSERLTDFIYLMRQKKIEPKEILPIYPDKARNSSIFLAKGVKGGGRGLKILPPFFKRCG